MKLVLPLALVAATVAGGTSPSAGSPSSASRIVFAANHSPQSFGEIYRVNPDGHRIDLSSSPAADASPTVSPDGKRLAFASERGGHTAIYVVGIDGHGLRRVSPPLFPASGAGADYTTTVWAPDSGRLAVVVTPPGADGSSLFLADLRGGWRRIARAIAAYPNAAWSGDGRFLSFATGHGRTEIATGSGVPLLSVPGDGFSAWSPLDQMAIQLHDRVVDETTVGVFDRHGHKLGLYPGEAFAWAPRGDLLALVTRKRLQVRHAQGEPIVTAPLGGSSVEWVGTTHLRVFGERWTGFDVSRHREWKLSRAASLAHSVIAPSGAVAAQDFDRTGGSELVVSKLGSTHERVLRRAPYCGDDGSFAALQFIPHTDSFVYQSSCSEPAADIYAVNADGSGLRDLTNTPTHETEPDLSPDGKRVVYVNQDTFANYQGGPQSLWVVPAAGGTPQQLTFETDQDPDGHDGSPSWSPDGRWVVFLRAPLDGPIPLYALRVTDGTMRKLAPDGYSPAWGPKSIAYLLRTQRLVLKTLDPRTGVTRTLVRGASGEFADDLGWSPGGRLAYLSSSTRHGVSIVVVGSNAKPIHLTPFLPHGSEVTGLAWSPDGTRFAFIADDVNGVGEIYTIGIDGKHLTQVTHDIGALDGSDDNLSWR
jgi:Tol biopolymer transport system component